MKPILIAFAVLLPVAMFFNAKVSTAASSETTCVEQCTDRVVDCREIGVTNLDNCLTEATSPEEKTRCKDAFRSERFACRVALDTCLATCSD